MKRIFLILVLLCIAFPCFATTATFQEGVSGYTGTREIIIDSVGVTSTITGAESGSYFIRSFTNNNERGLLYFNISTIPTNATVSSAVLTIQVKDDNCFVHTVVSKQIEDPNASGPFTQNSIAGSTNNTYGDYNYKDDTLNTLWKAGGTNFGDVDNNSSEGSFTTTDCPAGYESKTLTITNMVQSWVTTPTANSGMYIYSTRAASASVNMKSKFNATSSNRPLLTVNYTTPAVGDSLYNSTLYGAAIY